MVPRGIAALTLRTLTVVVLALAATAGSASGPPSTLAATPGDFAAIDAHVGGRMSAASIPGLAYAIVRDGQVVHLAGFGVADGTGRTMTPQTPMVIGSVGKTLTALAIRQLIDAGTVDLDSPVTRYLPWFTLATPGAAGRVTIRNLLEHTSGISTADGQDPTWYRPGLAVSDVARGLASVATDRPVGDAYEYSNVNYVVLGAVIESVSGQAYGDYLQAHVFSPLGMSHSYASLDPARADGLAVGHRFLFGIPVSYAEAFPTGMVPAGYQVSTAEDMAHFVAAFSNHGVYAGTDVVAPAGRSGNVPDYDITWTPITGFPSGFTPGHSGTTLNYNAYIAFMPAEHVGVAVLANANPSQFMGLPMGAADIGLDALRLYLGLDATSTAPGVQGVYVVIDLVLLALLALLAFEVIRLRGWRRRRAASRHPRAASMGSLLVDGLLPLAILVGVPFLVGATASGSADIPKAWSFLAWILPDIALTLLAVAFGLLAVGVVKLGWLLLERRNAAGPALVPAS